MSYKGIYRPSNPKKYRGDFRNIIYRSLWERKMMQYCDLSKSILEWSSEEFFIPYHDPTTRRLRRYFPDFFIKYTDKRGNIRKSVIEVKPMRETKEPVVTKKKSRKLRKCKYGRDPVSGKCRKKWGGNKGDDSMSDPDYM